MFPREKANLAGRSESGCLRMVEIVLVKMVELLPSADEAHPP